MNFGAALIGGMGAAGILLITRSLFRQRLPLAILIAPYLGLPGKPDSSVGNFQTLIDKFLVNGKSAPWTTDRRVIEELRKCSSNQELTAFRFEQLMFAGLTTLLVAAWIALRLITGHVVNPIFGFLILSTAFIAGGGFRSWLLKATSRNRIKEIEAQLPSVLDLLAFAVGAGEPVITAMQRVSQTCSGELALEIKRITSGLSVGDNFLVSLDRIQKELGSQSLARAFRALIMAIERGTPIADVLRAQAMDARNLEARKLMTLAGKKETLMMVPVVFLILPMIVIVALYPGLIALKGF